MDAPNVHDYHADQADRRQRINNAKQENAPDRFFVEICGKRFTLRKRTYKRDNLRCRGRGPITTFSRRARATRLRKIAEVRWADIGSTQFLTLTYPDSVSENTMDERKTHRYLINRSICKWVGRPLGCFWRVEWLPRLSGKFIGELRPHMHFMYVNCPRICEMRIRLRWMKILGVTQFTQVKIKHLEIAEAVAIYVAKYCAKEADSLYLDNVPKRNRTGRHAGELRPELIPIHELQVITMIEDALIRFIRRRACDTLWWYDPRFDEGFTMLGDLAVEMIRDFDLITVDREGNIVYTG